MSRETFLLLLALPQLLGFLLDALLGDPPWLFHPVRLIGRTIASHEKLLRSAFPKTPEGERNAGFLLALLLPVFFAAVTAVALGLCWMVHPALWFALETLLCYQLLAARDLRNESMAVYKRLVDGDLPGARTAVGRIVGRDTASLDEVGVTRAAVETVAENTSDGVVAPMLYMAVGSSVLGMWYKAVNTLDSMVGYKNARYYHFGRIAAKLDDVVNFIPARVSAWFMIWACDIAGFRTEEARRIYRRDHRNHASPNSAHTEAVCAGALGIQLGGDSSYFGHLQHKPTIGDDTRPAEPEDIRRANKLLSYTAWLSLTVCCVLRGLVVVAMIYI